MNSAETIKIELHDISFEVIRHQIKEAEIYRLNFSDRRPPLNITQAGTEQPFWTSVPQGRQTEAEFFGARIDEHLKKIKSPK
jgi:hypothetical protein